jgi:hypothetical protein
VIWIAARAGCPALEAASRSLLEIAEVSKKEQACSGVALAVNQGAWYRSEYPNTSFEHEETCGTGLAVRGGDASAIGDGA